MKFRVTLATYLALFVCIAASVSAQPPMGETIPIQVVIEPENPFDAQYENIFDLEHPKFLWFDGIARVADDPVGGNTLFVQFDWFDLNGELEFSPVFQLFVPLDDPQPFEFHWEIPFCPTGVSLHMSVGEGAPITVIGEFTHECVPEPSSMALMGLAAAGLVGFVVRRRRVRSR